MTVAFIVNVFDTACTSAGGNQRIRLLSFRIETDSALSLFRWHSIDDMFFSRCSTRFANDKLILFTFGSIHIGELVKTVLIFNILNHATFV